MKGQEYFDLSNLTSISHRVVLAPEILTYYGPSHNVQKKCQLISVPCVVLLSLPRLMPQ